MNIFAYGSFMINNSQLFMLGSDSTLFSLHFYKTTFGKTSVDVATQIACPGGMRTAFYSESLVSNDGSKIYSFFIYGSTQYLFFVTFNSTDLSIIESRYKSSIAWSMSYGSSLNGNYL